jgi:hypothetical protein
VATVTPNFDFPIPQSTDLVKDGATAIAALGTAIDTDFVDLKGGTTGQVLAKASNTDLDYTWTTPQVGDITGVTAGTGITGGGTSGDVTVSFDQTNFGGGQYAAGKNKMINGDFGIWQRGTSFASPSGTYTADRWLVAISGGSAGTASQQTFTPATAPVAGYEGQYFMRLASNAGATYLELTQRVEDVRTFAGRTVTLSFWAKATTSVTFTPLFRQSFGSGGSANVDTSGTAQAISSSSWTRYSVSVTLPSLSGKTIGTSSYLGVFLFSSAGTTASNTVDFWGVQLESGVLTPFQTASGGSPQAELAMAQRYYWRAGGDSVYQGFGNGIGNSSTIAQCFVANPVPMRVGATSMDFSNLGVTDTVSTTAVTALNTNLAQAGKNGQIVNFYVASGLTQFRPYIVNANNSTSAYIGFSAEL